MTITRFKQKMQNPFALVAQGFVGGVVLFWATLPSESSAQAPLDRVVAAAPAQQG